MSFWQARETGLSLHVRLTPRGGRDALEGAEILSDGQCVLKARVRAVAEDGKANEALIALLARSLGIPASRIRLSAGQTSRHKTLILDGDARELAEKLDVCTVSPVRARR